MLPNHRILFFIAVFTYAISLILPSFYTRATLPGSYGPGFGVLVIGWAGIFDGIFAWYGNLALFFSWVFYWTRIYFNAIVLAILAPIISLSFLFNHTMTTNEGGGQTTIEGFGVGYWVWIASQVISLLAIQLARPVGSKPKPKKEYTGY